LTNRTDTRDEEESFIIIIIIIIATSDDLSTSQTPPASQPSPPFETIVKMIMRPFALLCLLTSSASAWTMTGSSVSGFGGSVLLSRYPDSTAVTSSNAGASTGLVMKKGKSKVPQQMRATYEKQKEMAGMRAQMEAASRPGEDGLPVFNLFVRTKAKNVSLCIICVCLLAFWKHAVTNLDF
jgi:hypothetical protein